MLASSTAAVLLEAFCTPDPPPCATATTIIENNDTLEWPGQGRGTGAAL
jgi:hypothetical protein